VVEVTSAGVVIHRPGAIGTDRIRQIAGMSFSVA
jgi:hypothetical protein